MTIIVTNVGMFNHNERSIPGNVTLTFSNGQKVTYERSGQESSGERNLLSSFVQPRYCLTEEKSNDKSFDGLRSNYAIQLRSLEEQYKNAVTEAERLHVREKSNFEEYARRRDKANDQLYSTITKEMLENYRSLKNEIDSKSMNLDKPAQRFKLMISWLQATKQSELLQVAQMLELEAGFFLKSTKTPEIKWDVFLSHVQKDSADACRNISDALQKKGISSWLDKSADKPDKRGMIDGIVNARIFILVITKDYFNRPYCVFEWCIAAIAEKPMITIAESDPRYGGGPIGSFELNEIFKDILNEEVIDIHRGYWDAFITKVYRRIGYVKSENEINTESSVRKDIAYNEEWDNTKMSPNLKLHKETATVTTTKHDSWGGVVGKQLFQKGRHRYSIEILKLGATSHSWRKIFVGAVPQGRWTANVWSGWGYVASGSKVLDGSSKSYGEPYGTGDIITVELDFDKKSIEFYKNEVSLGIAYKNVDVPVFPVVRLIGIDTSVRLKSIRRA